MSNAYVTRADAEVPAELIELMASAYHESGRSDAMSLPPWDKSLPHWQEATRRDMRAALKEAEAAGYRVTRGPA